MTITEEVPIQPRPAEVSLIFCVTHNLIITQDP